MKTMKIIMIERIQKSLLSDKNDPINDLIYYLMLSPSCEFPISIEQSISFYKERLASRRMTT